MDDGVDRSPVTPAELAEARRYPVLVEWSEEDEVFLAGSPDLPGVRTHGATREEAAAMGEEAIAVWLSAMRGMGWSLPPPQDQARTPAQPPSASAPTRIRRLRRDLGVSQRAFAVLLNVSPRTVRAREQGAKTPDGAAQRLLVIAATHPEVVFEAAGARDAPIRRSGGRPRRSAPTVRRACVRSRPRAGVAAAG